MSAQQSKNTYSKIEEIKINSNRLRGTLVEELANDLTSFSSDAEQLLKFHGIYNQDNRDVRTERKKAGQELEHICMIRLALPGGRLTSEQYLLIDSLSDQVGNGSLRVTTRQGIQFHFVTKKNVKRLITEVNKVLITTYAGCGDVVRNVTACPSADPEIEKIGLSELADAISKRYKPASKAYYEIWLDGEKLETKTGNDTETVYGDAYLPRKFKIGLTSEDDNCIDVLSCDLALVLSKTDHQKIKIFVGGGLGRSHSDDTTKALLAQPLTHITRDQLFPVIDGIIGIQRDNGDRYDRSHARFKYLVENWGVQKILEELEKRVGFRLPILKEFHFTASQDHLGWTEQIDHKFSYGIKVPSGRIIDTSTAKYRSAIRELVFRFSTSVRFTAKEDVILSDIELSDKRQVLEILKRHEVPVSDAYTPISRHAFACPALPTCGLALAESERFLPTLLQRLDAATQELGLNDLNIELRMTGCPNGCARPYLGEIGIVGRSKKSYDIYLGANKFGNRLGEIYAIDIVNDALVDALIPILSLYAKEAEPLEAFGDFCNRVGIGELRRYAPEPRRRRLTVS